MMILAVWFSTCHMAIYTIFTGHGVWWWRFRWRRWEGGEGLDLVREYRLIISFSLKFAPRMIITTKVEENIKVLSFYCWVTSNCEDFLLKSDVNIFHKRSQDMSVLSWLVIVIAFSSTKKMSWKQQTEMNWSMKFWFVLHLKWSGWEKSTNW